MNLRPCVKAAYPAFEPTVVGIDVLDIEDTVDDAWAMLDVERPVDNPYDYAVLRVLL